VDIDTGSSAGGLTELCCNHAMPQALPWLTLTPPLRSLLPRFIPLVSIGFVISNLKLQI
jgi:hypothetical protein